MTDLRMIRAVRSIDGSHLPLHVEGWGPPRSTSSDTAQRLRQAQAPAAADRWSLGGMFTGLAGERRWQGKATDGAGRRLSVGHHLLWCASAAWILTEDRPLELQAGTAMWALLHDGHEYWTGDVERPEQLRRPELLRRQATLDVMILERIASMRPGLAAWASGRLWDADLVETVDRTASIVERAFYVEGDAREQPACLPSGWPGLPARLESRARTAAALQARFDELASQLEMVFAFSL